MQNLAQQLLQDFKNNLKIKIALLIGETSSQYDRILQFIQKYDHGHQSQLDQLLSCAQQPDIKPFLIHLKNICSGTKQLDSYEIRREQALLQNYRKIKQYENLLEKRIISAILYPKNQTIKWKELFTMTQTFKYSSKLKKYPNYDPQNQAFLSTNDLYETLKLINEDIDCSKLFSYLQRRTKKYSKIDMAVILVGMTGCGKSTNILKMLGYHIVRKQKSSQQFVNQILDGQVLLQEHKEIVARGGTKSVTSDIHIMRIPQQKLAEYGYKEDIILVDTPGYSDTQGIEIDIANNSLKIRFVSVCKNVKVVQIVEFNALKGDRGNNLRKFVERVCNNYKFNNFSDLDRFIIILFNKCSKNPIGIIGRKEMLDDLQDIQNQATKFSKEWHAYQFLKIQLKNDKNYVQKLDPFGNPTKEQLNKIIQTQQRQKSNIFTLLKEKFYERSVVNIKCELSEIQNLKLSNCIQQKRQMMQLYLSRQNFKQAIYTHELFKDLLLLGNQKNSDKIMGGQAEIKKHINQFYENNMRFFKQNGTQFIIENFQQVQKMQELNKVVEGLPTNYWNPSLKKQFEQVIKQAILSWQARILRQKAKQDKQDNKIIQYFIKYCNIFDKTAKKATLEKIKAIFKKNILELQDQPKKLDIFSETYLESLKITNFKYKGLPHMLQTLSHFQQSNEFEITLRKCYQQFAQNYKICLSYLRSNLQNMAQRLIVGSSSLTFFYRKHQSSENRQLIKCIESLDRYFQGEQFQVIKKTTGGQISLQAQIGYFLQGLKKFISSTTKLINQSAPHELDMQVIKSFKIDMHNLSKTQFIKRNCSELAGIDEQISQSMRFKKNTAHKAIEQLKLMINSDSNDFSVEIFKKKLDQSEVYIKNNSYFSQFLQTQAGQNFLQQIQLLVINKISKLSQQLSSDQGLKIQIYSLISKIQTLKARILLIQANFEPLNLSQKITMLEENCQKLKSNLFNSLFIILKDFKAYMENTQCNKQKIDQIINNLAKCFKYIKNLRKVKAGESQKSYISEIQTRFKDIFEQIQKYILSDKRDLDLFSDNRIKIYFKMYTIYQQIEDLQGYEESGLKLCENLKQIQERVQKRYGSLKKLLNSRQLQKSQLQKSKKTVYQETLKQIRNLDRLINKKPRSKKLSQGRNNQTKQYEQINYLVDEHFSSKKQQKFQEQLDKIIQSIRVDDSFSTNLYKLKPMFSKIKADEKKLIYFNKSFETCLKSKIGKQFSYQSQTKKNKNYQNRLQYQELKNFLKDYNIFIAYIELFEGKIKQLESIISKEMQEELQTNRNYYKNWQIKLLQKQIKSIEFKKKHISFDKLLQAEIDAFLQQAKARKDFIEKKGKQLEEQKVNYESIVSMDPQTFQCHKHLSLQNPKLRGRAGACVYEALKHFDIVDKLTTWNQIVKAQEDFDKIYNYANAVVQYERLKEVTRPKLLDIEDKIKVKIGDKLDLDIGQIDEAIKNLKPNHLKVNFSFCLQNKVQAFLSKYMINDKISKKIQKYSEKFNLYFGKVFSNTRSCNFQNKLHVLRQITQNLVQKKQSLQTSNCIPRLHQKMEIFLQEIVKQLKRDLQKAFQQDKIADVENKLELFTKEIDLNRNFYSHYKKMTQSIYQECKQITQRKAKQYEKALIIDRYIQKQQGLLSLNPDHLKVEERISKELVLCYKYQKFQKFTSLLDNLVPQNASKITSFYQQLKQKFLEILNFDISQQFLFFQRSLFSSQKHMNLEVEKLHKKIVFLKNSLSIQVPLDQIKRYQTRIVQDYKNFQEQFRIGIKNLIKSLSQSLVLLVFKDSQRNEKALLNVQYKHKKMKFLQAICKKYENVDPQYKNQLKKKVQEYIQMKKRQNHRENNMELLKILTRSGICLQEASEHIQNKTKPILNQLNKSLKHKNRPIQQKSGNEGTPKQTYIDSKVRERLNQQQTKVQYRELTLQGQRHTQRCTANSEQEKLFNIIKQYFSIIEYVKQQRLEQSLLSYSQNSWKLRDQQNIKNKIFEKNFSNRLIVRIELAIYFSLKGFNVYFQLRNKQKCKELSQKFDQFIETIEEQCKGRVIFGALTELLVKKLDKYDLKDSSEDKDIIILDFQSLFQHQFSRQNYTYKKVVKGTDKEALIGLFQQVWDLTSEFRKQCLALDDGQLQQKIQRIMQSELYEHLQSELKELLNMELKKIVWAATDFDHSYEVIDGKIAYPPLQDQRTEETAQLYGYKTVFAHFKEFQEKRIQKLERNRGINVVLPYSQISFMKILQTGFRAICMFTTSPISQVKSFLPIISEKLIPFEDSSKEQKYQQPITIEVISDQKEQLMAQISEVCKQAQKMVVCFQCKISLQQFLSKQQEPLKKLRRNIMIADYIDEFQKLQSLKWESLGRLYHCLLTTKEVLLSIDTTKIKIFDKKQSLKFIAAFLPNYEVQLNEIKSASMFLSKICEFRILVNQSQSRKMPFLRQKQKNVTNFPLFMEKLRKNQTQYFGLLAQISKNHGNYSSRWNLRAYHKQNSIAKQNNAFLTLKKDIFSSQVKKISGYKKMVFFIQDYELHPLWDLLMCQVIKQQKQSQQKLLIKIIVFRFKQKEASVIGYTAYETEIIHLQSFIKRTMKNRIEAIKNPINLMDYISNQLVRERDIKFVVLITSKPDFRLQEIRNTLPASQTMLPTETIQRNLFRTLHFIIFCVEGQEKKSNQAVEKNRQTLSSYFEITFKSLVFRNIGDIFQALKEALSSIFQ